MPLALLESSLDWSPRISAGGQLQSFQFLRRQLVVQFCLLFDRTSKNDGRRVVFTLPPRFRRRLRGIRQGVF